MTREKGVLDLLKAAELVHRVRPSVRILIVGPRQGEGPFAVTDAELAPYSEYVIATGSRRDVPSLLAMSDVFAFPSDYGEGVPRAVMEAALCGMPIVTLPRAPTPRPSSAPASGTYASTSIGSGIHAPICAPGVG